MKLTRGTPMRMYRASATVCRRCPAFGVCTRDRRRGFTTRRCVVPYRAWMRTDEAKEEYKLRKQLVEPVFGIINQSSSKRRTAFDSCCRWRRNGACWPPHSTCVPSGGYGALGPRPQAEFGVEL